MGDDLVDSGHLLGFRGVDSLDVRVGDGCLHQRRVQRLFGHLKDEIRAVVERSGHLRDGGRARVLAPPDPSVRRHFELELLLAHLAPEDLCGVHHGIDDGNVPGAAACVPVELEPVANLFAGRVRIRVKQPFRGDDEARRAEAALGRAVLYPRLLERVELLRRADPLDRDDLRALGEAGHLVNARAGHLAVHQHVARPAVSLAASYLGSREPELLAEHFGERCFLVDDDVPLNAVDKKDLLNHPVSSSFRISAGVGTAAPRTGAPASNAVRKPPSFSVSNHTLPPVFLSEEENAVPLPGHSPFHR